MATSIYENEQIRQMIGNLYIKNKLVNIDNFQEAIGELNWSIKYKPQNSDFKISSIKSKLKGDKLTLFNNILKTLGYDFKYNNYGDLFAIYKEKEGI